MSDVASEMHIKKIIANLRRKVDLLHSSLQMFGLLGYYRFYLMLNILCNVYLILRLQPVTTATKRDSYEIGICINELAFCEMNLISVKLS